MILFITGLVLTVLLLLRAIGILRAAARSVVGSVVIVAALMPVLVFAITLGPKLDADITPFKISAAVGGILMRMVVWAVYDDAFRWGLLPDGRMILWSIWAMGFVTVGLGMVGAVLHDHAKVVLAAGLIPTVLCKFPFHKARLALIDGIVLGTGIRLLLGRRFRSAASEKQCLASWNLLVLLLLSAAALVCKFVMARGDSEKEMFMVWTAAEIACVGLVGGLPGHTHHVEEQAKREAEFGRVAERRSDVESDTSSEEMDWWG